MMATIARKMRHWADRMDPDRAPRAMGYTFTIEPGQGIVFHENGPGCPLWHLGRAEYERAHTESRAATASLGELSESELVAAAMLVRDPARAAECSWEWERRLRNKHRRRRD
jgi:hypothetical protein